MCKQFVFIFKQVNGESDDTFVVYTEKFCESVSEPCDTVNRIQGGAYLLWAAA